MDSALLLGGLFLGFVVGAGVGAFLGAGIAGHEGRLRELENRALRRSCGLVEDSDGSLWRLTDDGLERVEL